MRRSTLSEKLKEHNKGQATPLWQKAAAGAFKAAWLRVSSI
jgi:hypothetical protein